LLIKYVGAQFDLQVLTGALTLRAAWQKSWDVNVAGTQVLTTTLVPLLLKSSDPRLLFVTSGTSSLSYHVTRTISLDTPPAAGWPKDTTVPSATSYRAAKTGLNMLVREWDRILKNDGVKVWAVSPGMLATGLVGDPEVMKRMGAEDASVAGPFFRGILEGKRDQDVGVVINRAGTQPW
jgi:NAD(P)-dependent dehydrogenase (short-subunit alcohol dehydrogenase family)